MQVWLSNQMTIGRQALDGQLEERVGVEYPYGSRIEHVYGAGPMIGGIIDGVRHVAQAFNGETGESDFRPDPRHPLREIIWRTSVIDSLTEPNRRGCDDDGDGHVDEDDLDGLDNDGDWSSGTDDVGSDGVADEFEAGCHGGYDAVSNPDPAFDNYDSTKTDDCHPEPNGGSRNQGDPDRYTEGNGIPDHGEPGVDEDFAAMSDNDLYCSAADTTDQPAGRVPMGIQLIQKTYAWKDPAYGAIIPFEFGFVNIGNRAIHDVYIGYYMDADVGPVDAAEYSSRNYSCYFDTLRTAYVHNPINRGSTPVGLSLMKAPKPFNELNYVYQWWNFTSPPPPFLGDSTIYALISGELFPDHPIATCGSPTNPSDVRFVFSFGPFESVAPGETLSVTLGLLSGLSVEEGPGNLKENAVKALILAKRMREPWMILPRPVPPSPALRVTREDDRITLDWGTAGGDPNPHTFWDPTNGYAESFPPDHWRRADPPCEPGGGGGAGWCGSSPPCDSGGMLAGGRTYEGYRLYRSDHQGDNPPAASFTLVREYDIAGDGIGFDFGIDTVYVDSNVHPGLRYWYAVTSFTIPDMSIVGRPTPSGGLVYDTVWIPGLESSILDNMLRADITFRASEGPNQVKVVPNPYRITEDYSTGGGGYEGDSYRWTEYNRKVRFIHLPARCMVRIYTVAGDIVAELPYESPAYDPGSGYMDWRLVSSNGSPIASGTYVFSVESEYGTQYGTFVIIR